MSVDHRSVAWGLVAAVVVASLGCGELRAGPHADDADAGDAGTGSSLPDASDPTGGDGATTDATTLPDGNGGPPGDGSTSPETLVDASTRLAAFRFPGPRTAQGSTAVCTPSGLVWRDPNGTLHAWKADTQLQVDYTFQAPRRVIAASDAFVAVDAPGFGSMNVYSTFAPGAPVANLPYAFNYAADETGVVRLDQNVNGTPLNGTKVRKWTASTGVTADVSTLLQTPQPQAGFALDRVVIPADVNTPYALYVVDVAAPGTTSVTFDGGLTTYEVLPATRGLLVSYARTGPVPAIRLYEAYDNARRVELGDEVKNIAPRLAGSPANEHDFIAHIAVDGDTLLYGSAFGIWAYGMTSGVLRPVQLGSGKVFVPDIMCVMGNGRNLAYRINGDATGQVWIVPLASVLP
jgi:hypothetical protein